MIQKLGLIVVILSTSLFALDITVTPSKTVTISSEEAEYFRNMLMKRHRNIDPDDAKKVLKENRVLADYFYRTYGIENDLQELQILFEEKLRNKLIAKEVEKVSINDDVLLSFYKDNKDEFYKAKEIEFKIYNFSTFNQAYTFYKNCQKDGIECSELALDDNITIVHKTLPLHNFNPQLKNLLKDEVSAGYSLPPQKFFKDYIVMEVVDIIDSGILPYEQVKERVKKDLQDKIKYDTKTKLIEQLMSQAE